MKLVLKDYVDSFKEDGELDKILSDLLWSWNFNILSKPTKGRQHGVDISAFGTDPDDKKQKIFLLAVKKGDLNRTTWNTGTNAIRPTLDEILDTYINTSINDRYKKYPIKIIVACNGYLSQNVNTDWTQYVNKNSKKHKVEFDFWGIEKCVNYIQKHIITDFLFPEENQKLFRKTLSFIDLPDYDLRHFSELTTDIFKNAPTGKPNRRLIRRLRMIRILADIVHEACLEMNNIKPSLLATEMLILDFWEWIRVNNMQSEEIVVRELMFLNSFKTQVNRQYLSKVINSFYVQDGLSFGIRNHTEYCLNTFEHIGLVAICGLSELHDAWSLSLSRSEDEHPHLIQCWDNASTISQGLGELILKNPASNNPKYDEHCIEINLAMLLFFKTEQFGYAALWLKALITNLHDKHLTSEFIPLFYTDYERLIQIDLGNEKAERSSSILITTLAEWCLILKQKKLYNDLRKMSEDMFSEVDLQMWYPEEDTESKLFTANATNDTGSTRSTIKLPNNFLEFEMEMIEEKTTFYSEGGMLHNSVGLWHIEFMANRHFRTYVFPNSWRSLLSSNFCFNKSNLEE